MATETRPGFRLPWIATPGEAEDQTAAGDAPVAEETQEPDMIETAETADAATASEAPVEPDSAASQPARRATKFMAELSRAMQAAAENARSETMARFEVEAKGVVEEIHATATGESADLRRKADDDVAAIREWSKAEIARIREETESRIVARKSGLDAEVEQHAAMVEARIERVAAVVAAFEVQMAAFFERLNAEEDPTRIATMAETMPDPPSLADVAASIAASSSSSATSSAADPSTGNAEALSDVDFAAAEAEAASYSGDLESEDDELGPAATGPLEAGGRRGPGFIHRGRTDLDHRPRLDPAGRVRPGERRQHRELQAQSDPNPGRLHDRGRIGAGWRLRLHGRPHARIGAFAIGPGAARLRYPDQWRIPRCDQCRSAGSRRHRLTSDPNQSPRSHHVARSAIIVALPKSESDHVSAELARAGFEVITVEAPFQLEALLESRRDIALAILDGEIDAADAEAFQAALLAAGRSIPALTVVSPSTAERLAVAENDDTGNEYFTRPYSADSIRWRVEAMCIRRETVDDGSGPVLHAGPVGHDAWSRRATLIAVFNPKGGVGKTTVATNLASSLQARKGKSVLLIDADTVTGHVTTSFAIEAVRTVADSWRDEAEGGPSESLVDLASAHGSGLRVVALTDSPINTEILDPQRVVAAIAAARRSFDVIVVDLHPSYSALNQAIFDEADRILVPVTPDVPAIRAAVQFRDVAQALGCRERLAMVVNRANSGVSVADMERTVGMPAFALIRSGGLLFVRAANEGRTVIEMFPREKITADFDTLADKLLGGQKTEVTARASFRFPSRAKEPARA